MHAEGARTLPPKIRQPDLDSLEWLDARDVVVAPRAALEPAVLVEVARDEGASVGLDDPHPRDAGARIERALALQVVGTRRRREHFADPIGGEGDGALGELRQTFTSPTAEVGGDLFDVERRERDAGLVEDPPAAGTAASAVVRSDEVAAEAGGAGDG